MALMANWWLEEFGDPCRSCDYDLHTPVETAMETVANAPQAYAAILAGSDGSQRHPDLENGWPRRTSFTLRHIPSKRRPGQGAWPDRRGWHGHDEAVMRKDYSNPNTDPLRLAAETFAAVTCSG